MINNAELGMTFQKLICDKYHIIPHPNAVSQFESAFNSNYADVANNVIDKIFKEINLIPQKCLTFSPSDNKKEKYSPHNFILSNGETLSIRTNRKGDKIAPRVVGQAGIKTFNEYFSDIAGYEIYDKSEIKKLVFEKIHLMLPVFIDYIFLSDYTIWIQMIDENNFSYTVFDKNSVVDINLTRDSFSFTRDENEWIESTTLKYNNKSLAEIQIHKNRTFKFRFVMNTLIELMVDQRNTTETLGITAEKVICDVFGLVTPKEYRNRYSIPLSHEIRPTIREAFKYLPAAKKCTGADKGIRGENSKCSYDFLLDHNQTLSLKTNTGKMVCPPEVGQPGAATCYYYFKDYIEGLEVTSSSFKKMVLEHISDIMPIYVNHLFDSDYLLWIFKRDGHYEYKVFDSNFAKNVKWNSNGFDFTKSSIDLWNESNTVKYYGISIGEFQVHKNRVCFKFRFNLENFEKMINSNIFD